MTVRLLVCGGRTYGIAVKSNIKDFARAEQERHLLKQILDQIHNLYHVDFLIEGEAKGADTLGKRWAENNHIEILSYPAAWKQHGKSAGFLRNQQMVDEGKPTHCVAFPGGTGTRDMIKRCREAGIPVLEVKSV